MWLCVIGDLAKLAGVDVGANFLDAYPDKTVNDYVN